MFWKVVRIQTSRMMPGRLAMVTLRFGLVVSVPAVTDKTGTETTGQKQLVALAITLLTLSKLHCKTPRRRQTFNIMYMLT